MASALSLRRRGHIGSQPYPAALAAIRAALRAASTTPVDIMCIGDSVFEGSNSTTWANTITQKTLTKLRAKYQPAGVTGGLGFVPPAQFTSTLTVPVWSTGAGATYSPAYTSANFSQGNAPGGLAYSFAPAATVTTASFTCTSFKIYYRNGFSTFAPFTVSIDGGGATTVTPTQTGAFTDNGVYSSGNLGAAASHTVTITNTGSNNVVIDGIAIFNGDEAGGVRAWVAGHSVWKSSDMNTLVQGSTPGPFYTLIAPKLIVVELGINDFTQGIAASTYQTNLQALVTRLRSLVPAASILLCGQYQRTATGVTQVDPYTSYKAAAKAISDADLTHVAYIDLDATVFGGKNPDVDSSSGLWSVDKLHPSDAGADAIATAFANLIR